MASFQLFLLTLVTASPPLFASPSPPLSVNVLFKAYSSERWNNNLIKNETLSQCYSAATAILVDFDHFWPGGLTLQSCPPRKKILSDLVYIPWRGLYWHCNIFFSSKCNKWNTLTVVTTSIYDENHVCMISLLRIFPSQAIGSESGLEWRANVCGRLSKSQPLFSQTPSTHFSQLMPKMGSVL